MSRSERGLVLLFLGLAVAAHGIRLLQERRHAAGELLLLPGSAPASVTAHRLRSAAAGRPLAPGERINPDSASAEELSRLPGIGMRLAKEIVADRQLRGPFGSLEALDRVRGIGLVTLRRLEPFLRFGASVVAAPALVGVGATPLNLNTASRAELERLPGVGPVRAGAILAYRESNGPFADPLHVARVPGIGPVLARRLADYLVAW